MKAQILSAAAVATLLGSAVSACQPAPKDAAALARSIASANSSPAASSAGRGRTHPGHAALGRRRRHDRSPTPARTSTPAAAPRSTTSPTTTATAAPLWTTSNPFGGTSMGGYYLYNNEWNTGAHPGPQTMWANSYHDWGVTSTQGGSGNPTAVRTYPDVQANFRNPVPVGNFSKITSTYSEKGPSSNAVYNASYDLWTRNNSKEIMFWVQKAGWGNLGTPTATVSFGGKTWRVYHEGSYTRFLLDHTATSGSVNLLGGLKYMRAKGWLSSSDSIVQIDFGWEICWTYGAPQKFHVSDYSLTADHS